MIGADVDTKEIELYQRALVGARKRLFDELDPALHRESLRITRTISRKYRGASETSLTATRQGTGALRGSYGFQVSRRGGSVIETVIGLMRQFAKGRALIYGWVHELGGIIRPTNTQNLAIPLAAVRNPSGIAPRPRDFPNAFVLNAKGIGQGLLVERRGDTIVPLFALRRQVRIPARPQGGAITAAIRDHDTQMRAALEAASIRALAA